MGQRKNMLEAVISPSIMRDVEAELQEKIVVAKAVSVTRSNT